MLILILLIIWTAYFYSIKNPFPEKQLEKSNQEYCLADDEVASYGIKKEEDLTYSETVVIISVKNKNTSLEKYNFKIYNVRENYHPVEIHRCSVYVARRFNYDPEKSKQEYGYRTEIWQYKYDGKGIKLLLSSEKDKDGIFKFYYSSDFRVDPSENYIALEYVGVKDGDLYSPNNSIVIKNLKTKEDAFVLPFQKITDKYPDLVGSIGLREWTEDGRYFWGNIFVGANALGFFRIDTITWKADIFSAPENVMGGDALNFNTGYITVHPYNEWYGIYEIEQIEKEKMRKEGIGSEIYVESLIAGKRYFVDEIDEPLWFFKPKWISNTELEYYFPSGEKRVYEIVEL